MSAHVFYQGVSRALKKSKDILSAMIAPPFRFPTNSEIDFIANRLGLRNDPNMQDWAIEVAEASDIPRYLALFQDAGINEEVHFALAEMTIQAFEDWTYEAPNPDLNSNPEWAWFLSYLAENAKVHEWQIWCWAGWDSSLDDTWAVAPFMRRLYQGYLAASA
ncbi:MAG: hypothetical protein CML02_15575 [Pseudooceanicola sp.]|jgi:hypothetical protein|nr:hypothetical protein [Pseudooceanicola sp.]|tara:strand:- start:2347 stop:2832 length:486 start_codon:yes stop_codon:yes gene_type:complete